MHLLTQNCQSFPSELWRARFYIKQSQKQQLQQSREIYFLFKSAFTVSHEVYSFDEMRRSEAVTDRLKRFRWRTLSLNGVAHTLYCMNTQFQNLNFMAQSKDDRQKKDNESIIYVLHDKILSFKSKDFIHSCGPILHFLTFQQSLWRAAPTLSLNPSKAWSANT